MAQDLTVDAGLDLELAVVRRTAVAEHLVVHRLRAAREVLLQLGLVVDVAALGVADVLLEDFDHRRAHRLVAEGDVHSPDERLGEVGEDVLVALQLQRVAGLLAEARLLAEQLAEAQHGGDPGARGAAHDVGTQPRQVPLREVGEAPVQLSGDAQAQHAVAEKLETLVRVAALGGPRRVGEDLPHGSAVQLFRQ